jgi:hypothetical protein
VAATGAEQTLDEVRRLRDHAKSVAHGGSWFPAAVLAVLVLSSTALYAVPFSQVNEFLGNSGWAGLPDTERSGVASYLYWFIGTPVAFAVIGLWYRWRARRTGMRVPWAWFAAVGLGLLAVLVALAAVPVDPEVALADANRLTAERPPYGWLLVLRTPLIPIAAAVVMLGWVERSRWLAVAGAWLGLVVWWQGYYGMGVTAPWMSWVVSGGTAHTRSEIVMLNRPGPLLILATLPLVAFAVVRAVRSGGRR